MVFYDEASFVQMIWHVVPSSMQSVAAVLSSPFGHWIHFVSRFTKNNYIESESLKYYVRIPFANRTPKAQHFK